jgi:hypothetical protein
MAASRPVSLLRIPCPILNPDRRADEAKRFADLIFQKSLVREVQFHGAVGK